MKYKNTEHWIHDFNRFCDSVDVKAVVAAADEHGNAPGYEKQLYAIAIVRAVDRGDLGYDWYEAQDGVALLWERGYRIGFSTDTFNGALRSLAEPHTRPGHMAFSRAG